MRNIEYDYKSCSVSKTADPPKSSNDLGTKKTEEHYDVFISYRRADNNYFAELLYKELTTRQFSVFLDRHESAPGEFPPRIEAGVKNSTCFILLLTENSLNRCSEPEDWITKEISIALEQKKKIIPVVPVPPFIFPSNFPAQLNSIKRLEQVELNLNFYQPSIEKLVSFLSPSKKGKKASTDNTTQRKRKLSPRAIAGIFILCLFVYVGFFFIGRWVALNEINNNPQHFLLSELAKQMEPKIMNGDELFFVCTDSKEHVLLFDYKNEHFSLENKSGSEFSGMFSQQEAFIGGMLLIHSGIWSFFSNASSHLKYVKKLNGKSAWILIAAVVAVEASYYYGKYTVYHNISDPFDSENLSVLNDEKKTRTTKKILADTWQDRNRKDLIAFCNDKGRFYFDKHGQMMDVCICVIELEEKGHAREQHVERGDIIIGWEDVDLLNLPPKEVLKNFVDVSKKTKDRGKKVSFYSPRNKKIYTYDFPENNIGVRVDFVPISEEIKQEILSKRNHFP